MAIIENPTQSMRYAFALAKRDMVVRTDGQPFTPDDLGKLKHLADSHLAEKENDFCAIELKPDTQLPPEYGFKTIREVFALLDGEDNYRLARARALLSWHSGHRFCARCGSPLTWAEGVSAKKCEKCDSVLFPRIEPCMIVLVSKGDEILLARHAQRNSDVYSCLAGFIEVGESAEHAVAREIFEETGIHVKNIRYRGSQSWPFPDQLMLAFTAEYESGEIKVQEDEIANAGWFRREDCPATPKPGSIAYKLIHNEI